MKYGDRAALDHDQWQLLVDVLDSNCDRHMLEKAQDALTRSAPQLWLEEAEVVDEAHRMLIEQARDETTD